MPRLPIFRLGRGPDKPAMPELIAAAPSITLEGLVVGVDNLRYDVSLSPRFMEAARAQIMRLIVRHGELEGLLSAEAPKKNHQGPAWMRKAAEAPVRNPIDKSDWKPLLAELHLAGLNPAKKRRKQLPRSAGALGYHQVSPHGNATAIRPGARALPRAA